jgi:hypothetical protein
VGRHAPGARSGSRFEFAQQVAIGGLAAGITSVDGLELIDAANGRVLAPASRSAARCPRVAPQREHDARRAHSGRGVAAGSGCGPSCITAATISP